MQPPTTPLSPTADMEISSPTGLETGFDLDFTDRKIAQAADLLATTHALAELKSPPSTFIVRRKRTPNPAVTLTLIDGTYVGQAKDGIPHGQGKKTFTDGSSYEGDWENGLEHGRGTYSSPSETYTGRWMNGFRNGPGVLRDAYGTEIFNGNWKNSRRHGNGTERAIDGIYTGDFENDARHGKGKLITPTKIISGKWLNGEYITSSTSVPSRKPEAKSMDTLPPQLAPPPHNDLTALLE